MGSWSAGVPWGSQSRYSLAKVSGERGEWSRVATQLETVQDVGGWVGGVWGVKGRRLSLFCPIGPQPAWLKRRISSPFCGCDGTASWRRPCPGAAEKEGDSEETADERPLSP